MFCVSKIQNTIQLHFWKFPLNMCSVANVQYFCYTDMSKFKTTDFQKFCLNTCTTEQFYVSKIQNTIQPHFWKFPLNTYSVANVQYFCYSELSKFEVTDFQKFYLNTCITEQFYVSKIQNTIEPHFWKFSLNTSSVTNAEYFGYSYVIKENSRLTSKLPFKHHDYRVIPVYKVSKHYSTLSRNFSYILAT